MSRPLWDIIRPRTFDEVFGQDEIVSFLKKIVENKTPLSILLFGPPGSGKTTIANIYAKSFDANFIVLSAVFSGVSDIKKIITDTKKNTFFNKPTILFVDEVHRFNKAQQDSFLPYIEDGTIIFIGATTENPSFSLNNALISRLRPLKLNNLKEKDLNEIISVCEKKKGFNISEKIKKYLINLSSFDARHLINMLENLITLKKDNFNEDDISKILQKKISLYDKDGDEHYNLISALHKSIRGSDPDASLFWLSRILIAGEDPLYVIRRLIRIASEDIGLADPNALNVTINAFNAFHMLGSPEGELAIAQATIYLALCPKSNAAYLAYEKAKTVASQNNSCSPPMHILNAPTKLMKSLGYSKGYVYDHDTQNNFSAQNYFPEDLNRENFYLPIEAGFEREMKKRLNYFSNLRNKKTNVDVNK